MEEKAREMSNEEKESTNEGIYNSWIPQLFTVIEIKGKGDMKEMEDVRKRRDSG